MRSTPPSAPAGGHLRPVGAGPQRVLAREECVARLASAQFGRLVYTDKALPAVVPVNHQVDGDRILVRLAQGSRAAAGVAGAVVAFEADEIDVERRSGWSVTVVGTGILVPAAEARAFPDRPLPHPWAAGVRDVLLQILMEQVTGRELYPAAVPDRA